MSGLYSRLLYLAGLLVAATSGHGQALPATPAKGSNIVWVRTTAPTDSVLQALAQKLRQHGFVMDTLDAERGVLTTKVVLPAASRAEEMKMRAAKQGADWKLIGTYVVPAYGSGVAYPAEFVGAEMMPAKTAFRSMEDAARAIPRGTLRYGKAKVKFGVFTKLEDALKSVW